MLALCLVRRSVFAQRCSPTAWADTRNGSPRSPGKLFWVRATPFAPWHFLRVAACPTIVLRVAARPTIVRRCRFAPDSVVRVAALSQTWFARVAARAASVRRCLVEQRFMFFVLCYVIGLAVPGSSDMCAPRATMLRKCSRGGACCGWRCSRKGAPTESARTPRSKFRDAREPVV